MHSYMLVKNDSKLIEELTQGKRFWLGPYSDDKGGKQQFNNSHNV